MVDDEGADEINVRCAIVGGGCSDETEYVFGVPALDQLTSARIFSTKNRFIGVQWELRVTKC